MKGQKIELPPLPDLLALQPEVFDRGVKAVSETMAEQLMQDYARAAIEAALQSPAVQGEQQPAGYDFIQASKLCEQGLNTWKEKPHNKRWWKQIDGTPIPNDLLCCVAEAFTAEQPAQPAEQQPAPDVAQLVEALEDIAGTHHHSASAGEYFAKVARAALAAYRKQGVKP